MTTPARDALVAVATLLAPDVPEVATRAAAAHDDPDAYVSEHADRLDNRGIDEPFPLLAWIALVDSLDDHGLLAEVDWKEAPGEIAGQLRVLRSAPAADELWTSLAASELPTYEFLETAGERLLGTGTALAVLDIESDCYPLVLLPAARADELVTSAKTAGFAAEVFGR
ncbi:hypothetical protein SAMN05421837_102520 [Amycolatopsis pretoriensis]|uniref:DUF6630 domain-containing protein n=1 Tax=Amycolatopsis pretoriensis TaxID=218821 RepID=A0A1H5QD15_9PSEU|nr:DUF6630 family protein [Amycolatopsis pretoriensis]SEF24000.1 hypothetical protein SAMN05421837_102520 [Amycolatopsis pretoriensis]